MPVVVTPIANNPSILDTQESQLVVSREMTRYFGLPNDYIQFFVYNNTDTLVSSNLNFQNYTVTDNKEVSFDPAVDIVDQGIRLGTYRMVYNFQRPVLTINPNLDLFVKSISQDRTEIKIATTTDNTVFYSNILNYINTVQNREYFLEFYLDFGNNVLVPCISLAAEQDINGNSFAIVKLLDPLSENITVNSPLNVIEKIVDTQQFQTTITSDINTSPTVLPSLREANFSIDVNNKFIGSSDYYNYDQIVNYTGSYFQNIVSYVSSSNPTINVDYTNYNSFIHFASAYQKLETFRDQLVKIQSYQTYLNSISSSNPDYLIYTNKINSIIQGFDGYENYLYYESSSYAWPKQNTTKPYINYSVTSSQALYWYGSNDVNSIYYGGQVYSSSLFDEFNPNNLVYGLPTYIQEKSDFGNVKLFVNSMGQMFDDIWIYIKAMTDLWKAENKLTEGISKDLVADALKSLGIKLHTDGDQDDLFTYLYGINSSGSQNFVTQSWQTPVTASTYTMSGQDEAKSVFKRIYHNLPTLLKSKGTTRFINYLNTLYGVPDTILYPIEYGGVDKNTNTIEYNYNKFTYALQFSSSKSVTFENSTSSSLGIKTLEFRFKPNLSSSTPQTLISESNGTYCINVETTSSNGYSYGNIKLISGSYSSSVLLPIYVINSFNDYNWWNVAWVNSGSSSVLYVKSEINGEIGHQASSSFLTNIPDSSSYSIKIGSNFYGQIQEFRGWSESISESVVNTHTLNPESYIGNTSSSVNNLLFHFPLGNDLKLLTTTTTGSQPRLNSNYYLTFTNISQSNYVPFVETYYSLPAIGGYSTPVTDKIRIIDTSTATTRLQPKKSIIYNPTSSRTLDIHVTQTGFSPQDQINNDIIAQLGNTYNLDNIIGNPQLSSLDTYPELDTLKEDYFEKYINSYNYKDFVVLIETFHKSLFRYLEDYIPGRSNNNTGVVIKSHILERNKVKRYEPTVSTSSYYEGQTSVVSISGSNPGNYCCTRNSSENEAFYTGEISGSLIDVNDYYTQNNPFALLPTQSNLANFNKQYGGWDALNNNVSNSLISQFKQVKQYSSSSLWGPCYRQIITNLDASPRTLTYTTCDKKTVSISVDAVSSTEIVNSIDTFTFGITSAYFNSRILNIDYQKYTDEIYISSSFEWQDSLLSDSGYVNSRENGVKLNSNGFNQLITNGNIGEVPNVEQTIPFILYYDWAGGTLAERQGSANYHIKYLIDESGSVFKPEYSSSYWYNTDQGFGSNVPVNVTMYDALGTNNAIETTVYRPLKVFKTILYSDTGSLGTNKLQPGFNTTMSFNSPGGYLTNIETYVYLTNNNDDYVPINFEGIKFDTIQTDNAGGWNTSTRTYTAPGNFQNQVQITASVYYRNANFSTITGVSTTLYKNDVVISNDTRDINGSTLLQVILSQSVTYNEGDRFYVTYNSSDSESKRKDFYVQDSYSGTFFKITAGPGNITPIVTSSYFTSSFQGTVLTSSNALSYFYGPGYSQTSFLNSGFDEPLPFTIQSYDQIRFGGNESQVYTIVSSSFSGSLYLYLDRTPQGQNLNYFSIRRLVDDPGFVILNTTNTSGPGFIIPKYLSPEIKTNLNNIIQNLSAKSLIP